MPTWRKCNFLNFSFVFNVKIRREVDKEKKKNRFLPRRIIEKYRMLSSTTLIVVAGVEYQLPLSDCEGEK